MVLGAKRTQFEGLAIIAAAAFLAAAGCGLFSPREEGLVFNHKVHAEKGMACDSCHEGYEDQPSAGMPTFEVCLTCHGPKADKAPPLFELEIQKHSPEDSFVSGAKYYDLKFSHALHQEKQVECSECHGDVGQATRVTADHRPGAEMCLGCHSKRGLSMECAVCHGQLRKEVAPRTHGGAAWMRTHGRDPVDGYMDRGHGVENCSLCHSQSSCDGCHRFEKPQDHTQFFRLKGHGAVASMERERCQACHQENFCVRCHSENAPRSHFAGSWGGSQSQHCLSCHLDISDSGCFVCHKGAPSHRQATRIPGPPHPAPGADCYSCHLRPPHADNGSPCTACHKR